MTKNDVPEIVDKALNDSFEHESGFGHTLAFQPFWNGSGSGDHGKLCVDLEVRADAIDETIALGHLNPDELLELRNKIDEWLRAAKELQE